LQNKVLNTIERNAKGIPDCQALGHAVCLDKLCLIYNKIDYVIHHFCRVYYYKWACLSANKGLPTPL